jgi:hypothetical protein
MHRVDNATSAAVLPTPQPVGPNPNSYFQPQTIVDVDWANALQEEICAVIENAGVVLDKTQNNQLLTVLNNSFASLGIEIVDTTNFAHGEPGNILAGITTGQRNSAYGYRALQVIATGNNNTACGYLSLQDCTGSNNTGNGTFSGQNITTGNNNTAIGDSAASNLITGSNNTSVGYNAQTSTNAANNEFTLGDLNIAVLRCNITTITSLSDARDKTDIADLPLGLDFINTLRPVTFHWDRRDWYDDGISDSSKKAANLSYGFIAQELQAAQVGNEWLDLVYQENPEKLEASYGKLLIPLIKAVQELSARIIALEARVLDLETP